MNKLRDNVDLVNRLKQDMNLRLVFGFLSPIFLLLISLYHPGIGLRNIFIISVVIAIMYGVLKLLVALKAAGEYLKYLFIVLDVLMISHAISITGGVYSPLYLIYVVVLLYEGLTLDKRKYLILLIMLIAVCFPVAALATNYELRNLVLQTQDLIMFAIRYLFVISLGVFTVLFEKKLMEQRLALKNVLSDNIKLSVKLKKFNQELIDRVLTATNSLENEAELNMVLFKKTQHLFMNTTKALISAIDAKDPYTYGHTDRMAGYSIIIFDEYCLTNELIDKEKLRSTLELASLLHDIGKIGIHDKVLLKPGKLNDKEWKEIKKHPIIGSNILESIEELDDVREIITHHHERYDGQGYISGLKKDEIPLLSRIISVADAFDAMTSSRPYRKKMKSIIAVNEIEKNSGTQFDPKIVEAFKRAFEKGNIK